MNTQAILNQVERLHAEASVKIRNVPYSYGGKTYLFNFNGNSVDVTESGARLATFNTRKLFTAKQWLREYLAN